MSTVLVVLATTIFLSPQQKDKNNGYLDSELLSSANLKNFTQINDYYSTDGERIYDYTGGVFPREVDHESFTPLSYEYSKDKNHVYIRSDILEGADPQSFEVVELSEGNTSYAKDKNHIFYRGTILNLPNVDTESVEFLDHLVIKDKKNVYLEKDRSVIEYEIITRADSATFQKLGPCGGAETSGGNYFKDKNNIFVIYTDGRYKILEEVDASSFEYLGSYGTEMGSGSYAKDKDRIYGSCGEILENFDPKTFRMFGDMGMAQDKNSIISWGNVVEGADVASFEFLGEALWKDKNRVYYLGRVIEGADLATFTMVKEKTDSPYPSMYGKDKNHVYDSLYGDVLLGVKPEECTPENIKGCSPPNY